MRKILKLALILIIVITVMFIGTFKVHLISGRFYIESRWTSN